MEAFRGASIKALFLEEFFLKIRGNMARIVQSSFWMAFGSEEGRSFW
jgi:hypothetical protein